MKNIYLNIYKPSLVNLKKYDAVFLNGNGEESSEIENIIKNIKPNQTH